MAPVRPQRTFLVVDDEPDILDAIQRLFRRDYRVLTARTAEEALEVVATEDVQVVMSDQRMPRMTGIEFLAKIRETHPDLVRVLFTGYSNIDHVIDAINEGHVYRYISKPWKPAELKLFVEQAFEYYDHRRERVELLDQLREANARLEDQNTLLTRANEELKMLDRVKSVFMEVVSHELNTPIAVILGYAFLLRRETAELLNPVATKALDGIDSSANRLKSIASRIFKMLSEDGPASTLNVEPLTVEAFIGDLRNRVDVFLAKRDQTLRVEVDETVEQIVADREKLGDVCTNLLMNAIKFSRDGQEIVLEIAADPDDADGLIIVVEDQGIGISEEDLSKVFEAFFSSFNSQYHSSGSFEFGKRGIGLGLSVARRFTEMHGGRIDVESAEGKGTRFVIHLPRDPREQTNVAPLPTSRLVAQQ